ncbi:MAG: phosphoribosylformylglycinamidine synthase subunit PurS [Candidatus Nezhaarchaeales archaeon]
MLFKASIVVKLKPELTDGEGEATYGSLRDLGYNVRSVRVGKLYEVVLEANDEEEAVKLVDSMCRRLLANPEVKDDYSFRVEALKEGSE